MLKIENRGMFASFAFYGVVGIICFIILGIIDPRLIHIGIIGILNLIAAYGLFKRRFWAFWVVIALFFIATIFSAIMLYYSILESDLLFSISMTAYLVLTWIFTAYTSTKRNTLES